MPMQQTTMALLVRHDLYCEYFCALHFSLAGIVKVRLLSNIKGDKKTGMKLVIMDMLHKQYRVHFISSI
jgi:hypothetical protein